MKAVVDAEKCIGCGLCAQVAPDIYEMQGDKAVTKIDEISEDKTEEARSGAEQCPTEAIIIS